MAVRGNYHGDAPAGLNIRRPPFLAYDPALYAEQRAIGRGLGDLRQDTRIAGQRAEQDWRIDRNLMQRTRNRSLTDLSRDYGRGVYDVELDYGRGVEDTELDYGRGMEDIGFQRADVTRSHGRARDDFAFQLEAVGRQYGNLASSQGQAINAAGVGAGGAAAAAAKRRASNQAFEERPIRTGQARLDEDFATQLSRLGTAESRLGADRGTTLGRLGTDRSTVLGRLGEDKTTTGSRIRQDYRTDLRLGRTDFRRGKQDRGRELSRATREAGFGVVDLGHQMLFDARQRNPGAFSKTGKRQNR